MDRHLDEMLDLLIGLPTTTSGRSPWPGAIQVSQFTGRPLLPSWCRALVVVQCVLLVVILGWLAAGQPGLTTAGAAVERGLRLEPGDLFEKAE